jgi:hypothetical protein
MIIYPAQNSSSLLVGALFFDRPFPAFLGLSPSATPFGLAIPAVPPMHPQTLYGQGMVSPHSYDTPGQSSNQQCSDTGGPANINMSHTIPRQVPYNPYMMTYGQGNPDTSPTSASSITWTSEMHYGSGGGNSTQQNPTSQYR